MIKKANLKWVRPLTAANTLLFTSIAIHHFAHPTWGVAEVHDYHGRPVAQGGRGWKGHAYNYEVDKNGDIWEIRGYQHEGGGLTGSINKEVLSIGFQGNYDTEKLMPEAQFNSGVWLIKYLKQELPNIKTVDGHKKWESTACPGRYFPLEEMIKSSEGVSIMGKSELTVEQMRKFLRDVNPDAPEVEQLFLDEGATEGVRGDIAFCQAIHETDYFRFTGTAKIEWNNPAGLGVTGPVGVGNRFKDWQTGIRAQIQHLKAYATKEPFKNPIVDLRYAALVDAGYLGKAPLWTDLNGKWAYPGKTYGQSILKLFDRVKSIVVDSDSDKVKLLTEENEALKNEIKRLNEIIIYIKELVKGE